MEGFDLSHILGAVLAVQFGNILTTYVGIYGLGLGEANPFMVVVLDRFGILGLAAVKFCWYGIAIAGAAVAGDSRRMLKYCFPVYLLIGGMALVINVALIVVLLF